MVPDTSIRQESVKEFVKQMSGSDEFMKQMSGSDEFMKQMSGSGAANIATAFVFFVFWFIRNKCRHSRCKGRSICCDCEIKDDESGGEDIESGRFHENGTVRKKIKIQVQKLQRGVNQSLRGSD